MRLHLGGHSLERLNDVLGNGVFVPGRCVFLSVSTVFNYFTKTFIHCSDKFRLFTVWISSIDLFSRHFNRRLFSRSDESESKFVI